ncbi:MAG: radical SAM family heme chaperone HemW [Bermanella sp.]
MTLSTSSLQLPPLALYIHVPWCVRKCPYCDFNSHQAPASLPEQDYVQALLDDLRGDAHWVQGRKIESIFIGGGTPSMLSVQAYEDLFSGLKQQLDFAADIEITLEANPGTFEAEKFAGYRKLGINRLSIGIQSFQDPQLKKLGRIHSAQQATAAVQMAIDAGFDNFNLDLMHGLPGQDLALALSDLRQAIALKPSHISWYQLTIEPNTEYFKYPPKLPQDETLWDIQEAGQALLAEHGFQQYEISAYAQEQRQARHNINYWQFGDYLGIGAGAHGKITLPNDNKIVRSNKTRLPKDYLNRAKIHSVNVSDIEMADRDLEFFMNALRLYQGTPFHVFAERTGLSTAHCREKMANAIEAGLLEDGQEIKTTAKGRLFLNELLEKFL